MVIENQNQNKESCLVTVFWNWEDIMLQVWRGKKVLLSTELSVKGTRQNMFSVTYSTKSLCFYVWE